MPVIFCNFEGYDSHDIMQEIGKFHQKMLYQMEWKNI